MTINSWQVSYDVRLSISLLLLSYTLHVLSMRHVCQRSEQNMSSIAEVVR